MLNKLSAFIREHGMLQRGDRVICALSGGADSVALLLGFCLLRQQLNVTVEAAHFNHHLRGTESDADEEFVRQLCDHYDVPLHLGSGQIRPGKKGLEAAAREARYAFLRSLSGKVATAHTADDNAETVLLHMVRGTGLKGLGGIAPISGNVIRPMLSITRQEVEAFLDEYCQDYRTDSSNLGDDFLRNRLRHQVIPVLTRENPRFSRSTSAMALRLRQDEDLICSLLPAEMPGVQQLKAMHPALRSRLLERFLKEAGVREPEMSHIAAAEQLVFSPKPSARADLPGGVTVARNYDTLEVLGEVPELGCVEVSDNLELPQLGLRVTCAPAAEPVNGPHAFTVAAQGKIYVRSRRAGDVIRLPGGSKSLKKLFIDRKIPAGQRPLVLVVADEKGILGVQGFGANLDRIASSLPGTTVTIEPIAKERIFGG